MVAKEKDPEFTMASRKYNITLANRPSSDELRYRKKEKKLKKAKETISQKDRTQLLP